MSNLYETFVMEMRSRLQSCNVYVIFNENSDNQISIRLKLNEIIVSNNDFSEIIPISNFKILTNSLSYLQLKDNTLTFRFSTESVDKTTGQFKTEFILNDRFNDLCLTRESLIKRDLVYTIECGNCKNVLSEPVSFHRVLPLPSDTADPSEWFCHKHESALDLKPKTNDCFYSDCYVHLNQQLFQNYLIKSNIVVCKRCFAWLGITLKQTIQFWLNTIVLHSETRIHTNPLNDITKTITNSFDKSIFDFCKFLFECNNFDGNDYLCVWILEKNLKLLINGSSYNGIYTVAKLLFRFENEENASVNEWKDDFKVNHVKISKPMMVSLLKHLREMRKLIPNHFSISNNFFVSYLILDK